MNTQLRFILTMHCESFSILYYDQQMHNCVEKQNQLDATEWLIALDNIRKPHAKEKTSVPEFDRIMHLNCNLW